MRELVVFDVDGVLLDSLGPHLAICGDLAREYGLDLRVPSEAEVREMVRNGVRISPMEAMFLAVGFPDSDAKRADRAYQREFAAKYGPQPYVGARQMLDELSARGVRMGIVTANTLANVEAGLGELMGVMDRELVYAKDDFGGSKAEALREISRKTGVAAERRLYVGDQPADRRAAEAAEWPFLGVAYGWGLDRSEVGVTVVESVEGIGAFVLG